MSERVDDTSALEALFRDHAARVVRLAALLGAADPEDVAQEAFVRLHGARGRVAIGVDAVPYLNRIVVNLCRDRARRAATADRHRPRVTSVASAEEVAQHRDELARVLAAVRALPQSRREALVLWYWLDLPYAQVAEAMGVRTGTAKSLVSRALTAVEKQLEER